MRNQITKSTKEESEYVRNRLIHFNTMNVPEDIARNYEEVNLSIKNEEGEVIAGLLSVICWNWLEVDILWVNEKSRGLGYGSKLLHEAEGIARRRGCTFIKLNTFSFQAPLFYEKYGYQEIAVIEDAPRGHKHYYFKKDIK